MKELVVEAPMAETALSVKRVNRLYMGYFKDHKWRRFGTYYKANARLAYPYLIVKGKDIAKARVITSMKYIPLRNVYKFAAQAPQVLITKVMNDSSMSFNVGSTHHAPDSVAKAVQEVCTRFSKGDKIVWLTRAWDVKQMYPSVPTALANSARQFIFWCATRGMRKCQNQRYITVHKKDKAASRIGRGYGDVEGSVKITFDELDHMLRFELGTQYVNFGGTILQLGNIAAGSFSGMPTAVAYCIFHEYQWLNGLYHARYLTRSAVLTVDSEEYIPSIHRRYADDCRIAVPVLAKAAAEKEWALQHFNSYFTDCYDDSTALEEEPVLKSGFEWLQSTFKFSGCKVSVTYKSKNWQSWMLTGRPKCRMAQSYFSYSASLTRRKYAVLVGKFHEIFRFSLPKQRARMGVRHAILDIVDTKVPRNVVISAANRMFLTTGHKVWQKVIRDIYKVYLALGTH